MGIAIGAGTDVAIESAGVILVSDRIQDVFSALILGKASYRTLTGNVIVAVIFYIFGMILAAMGMVSPILAISVMVLSIFAILLNTLRIRVINLEREEEPEIAPLAEVEFLIPNLVCEGCAEKINTILRSLPDSKRNFFRSFCSTHLFSAKFSLGRITPPCLSIFQYLSFKNVRLSKSLKI